MKVFKTDDHWALLSQSLQDYRDCTMEAGSPKFGAHFGHCGIMEGQEASEERCHVLFQVTETFQPAFKLCSYQARGISLFYG